MHRLFTPESRFEKTLEFKPLILSLNKLRLKENELSKTTSQKHTIIAYLLSNFENAIAEFNEKKPHSHHCEDNEDLLELLNSFRLSISEVIENNSDTLSFRRNKNKEIANAGKAATPVAAAGGAIAFGLLTGVTGGLTLAVAALGGAAYYLTSNTTPDTVLILNEMQATIERISNSLNIISSQYSCRK